MYNIHDMLASHDDYQGPERLKEARLRGAVEAAQSLVAKTRAIYDELASVEGQHEEDYASQFYRTMQYQLAGVDVLMAEGILRMALHRLGTDEEETCDGCGEPFGEYDGRYHKHCG